jgi:hypothetical protein
MYLIMYFSIYFAGMSNKNPIGFYNETTSLTKRGKIPYETTSTDKSVLE